MTSLGNRPSLADIDELEGLRVLVVDDEEVARERVTSILSEHGVILIPAHNAADAFEALVQYRPDVMISDIAMPIEDGYSFIRRVRRLPPENGAATPAAALTIHASAEDRTQALVAGYQMHIPKPAQAAELVAAVASLARIARSMKSSIPIEARHAGQMESPRGRGFLVHPRDSTPFDRGRGDVRGRLSRSRRASASPRPCDESPRWGGSSAVASSSPANRARRDRRGRCTLSPTWDRASRR